MHHDGSALYVSNLLPAIGERITLYLRVPVNAPVKTVFLRTAPDGENRFTEMRLAKRDSMSSWWAGKLQATMPRNPYRFKVLTTEGAYYVTASGVSHADGPDWSDFKILANYDAPTWVYDSVFYQIFPERFRNGDPGNDVQDGQWNNEGFTTQKRAWDKTPLRWEEGGSLDFYGGDLPGIAQSLDYLVNLGVNALYLTPIFDTDTNHGYDIKDFKHVAAHMGGDEALAELRRALDQRAMRLMLDVTPNHCSWHHPWFLQAQANLNASTNAYFTFYHHPSQYEAWFNIKTLPRLNYQSEALREEMYCAPDSVLRRWLREPYRIDGWRLDVQNMMARHGKIQLGNKVGRQMRRAIKGDNPEIYFIGEHFYDATTHLQGDELDAIMNYQGFLIPLRRWLSGHDIGKENNRPYSDSSLLPGEFLEEQWRRYRSALPWIITRQQFNQLNSHDTARILTVVKADKALNKLAAVLLMTYVGVPCLYYGEEIGMTGSKDPYNRAGMIWDESARDKDLRSHYQKLIQLRRNSSALREGGFQPLYANGGLIAYQRQCAQQRLIIVGYRGPEDLPSVDIPVWQAGLPDRTVLQDYLSDATFRVDRGELHLEGLSKGTALILEAEA